VWQKVIFFTYDVTISYNSSDSSVEAPQSWLANNVTKGFKATVADIFGSKVEMNMMLRYKNGSDSGDNINFVMTDIETGPEWGDWFECISKPGEFPIIIASNLTANDKTYPAGSNYPTIASTTSRSYQEGQREINHVAVNQDNYLNSGMSVNIDAYYDKITGILLEARCKLQATSTGDQQEYVMTLQETNAWIIPEFSSIHVLILLMLTFIIGMLALRRLRLKT
jgi:hypothetical protein